jgi:hypothetical protein
MKEIVAAASPAACTLVLHVVEVLDPHAVDGAQRE